MIYYSIMIDAERAKEIVEIIGPCTEDIRDCEIMRAAISNRNADESNTGSQNLRRELAGAACADCIRTYLSDLAIQLPGGERIQ